MSTASICVSIVDEKIIYYHEKASKRLLTSILTWHSLPTVDDINNNNNKNKYVSAYSNYKVVETLMAKVTIATTTTTTTRATTK